MKNYDNLSKLLYFFIVKTNILGLDTTEIIFSIAIAIVYPFSLQS